MSVLAGRDAMADDLFDLVIEGNDAVFAATGVGGLVAGGRSEWL